MTLIQKEWGGTNGCRQGQINGQIDILMDVWMDAQTDGLTDQQMETVVGKNN